MNVKAAFVVFFTIFITSPIFSKTKTTELIGDCANAVEIIPNGNYKYSESPNGFGEKLDIYGNHKKSLYYFEQENNTAWFTFVAPKSGTWTFKITPLNLDADFDFLLFEYTDENFCDDLTKKKIKPIRTNISRNNPIERSVTGLSVSASKDFVHSGVGNHLSNALSIEEGKRYYLVINNVYGIETAFKMSFEYLSTTTISGIVKDETTGEIIKGATVTWEEKSGEVLATTTSNVEDGTFEFEVPVKKGKTPKEYVLSATKPNYFYYEKLILASHKVDIVDINVVIPQLKKGKNRLLKNMNFRGGQTVLMPGSNHSLRRLYKLMKRNKTLVIRIEGHTDARDDSDDSMLILSEGRSSMVEKYLISRGIDPGRISSIGYGGEYMLFPNATTDKEWMLNRRVEIMVMGY